MPINIGLHYSSNVVARSLLNTAALPLGWTTDYTRFLTLATSNGTTTATLTVESGDQYQFVRASGATAFVNQQAYDYNTLSVDGSGNYVLRYLDGDFEVYAASTGAWIQKGDRIGNRVNISYDLASQTRTIRNAVSGQALQQKYSLVNGVLRLLRIEDEARSGQTARVVNLAYNSNGKLNAVTDPAGRVHRFDYDRPDQADMVTRYFNPLNSAGAAAATMMVYNPNGQVITQHLPNNNYTNFNWQPLSNTDYHLEVVSNEGFPASERRERFLFQTQNVNGSFTSTGRILRQYVVNSTTQYTEFRYDARGNRTDVFDPKGRRTQYLYDANGFLIEAREYTAIGGSSFDATLFQVNSFGQPTQITDAGNTIDTYAYNATTGLLESVTKRGIWRNSAGSMISAPRTTTIQYDNLIGLTLNGVAGVKSGLPTQITYADGTVIKQEYDTRGYPSVHTTDAGTGKLNITDISNYDWRGFLVSSTDLRGINTSYEYLNNPAGGQFGNLGIATALVVDSAAGGRQVRSEYTRDAMLNLVRSLDDAGAGRLNAERQISWGMIGMEAEYSPLSEKVKEKQNGGTAVWREQKFEYNAMGEMRTLTEVGAQDDGSNRVTTLNSDSHGWLDTVVAADGRTIADYEYDSDLSGTLRALVDGRGTKTSYTWDDKGRLKTITEGDQAVNETAANGSATTRASISAVTTQSYDNEDRLIRSQVTQADGSTRILAEYVYDGMDRMQTYKDGLGNRNEYFYDFNRDWLIQQNIGDNNIGQRQISNFNYDAAGRLREAVVNPGLSPNLALMTTFAYTLPGSTDKWLLQKVTNPRGKATEYSYDSIGNLFRSKDADATSFEYSTNNLGYLTKMASYRPGSSVPVNAATDYTVNLLGEVEALSRNSAGLSPMVETWAYKTDGALKQMTDLSGQIIRQFYDTTGRLTSADYAGTTADPNGVRSDASYSYFDNNLLKTATSKPDGSTSESTSYEYDAANRLLNRNRSGRTVSYGYMKDHTLASINYWNRGNLSFARDGSGQVQSMDLWGASNRSTYSYRSTQQLDSVSRSLMLDGSSKNLSTTFGYDNARRLNKLTSTGTHGSFAVLDYPLLDENGSPKTFVETLSSEAPRTTSYSYDNLDRLTQVNYPSVNASIPGYSEINQYDFTGNRTEVRKNYPSRKSLNHADYNRDGKGDLSWFQSSNGLMNYWLMGGPNGGQFQSSVALMPTSAEAGWKVMLTADFNSDGIPDIVARNFTTGANALWIMGGINGNKRLAILALRAVPGGTWEPAAAADFNNDGNKDLIWRNYSTGENYIWFMGGVDGASNVTERLMGYLGVNWRLCGAGDFDKDGVPDLVWHSPTDGAFTIWRMGGSDGATQQSGGYTSSVSTAGLRVDSVADVNGDGNADISWRQLSDGTSFSWLMNGFSIASNLSTSSFAAAGWSSANTNQEMANSVRQIKAYNAFDVLTNGGETSNTNQSLSQTSDAQSYAFDAAERLMKSAQTDGSSIEYLYDALGNLIRSKRTLAGQSTATSTDYVIDESVGLPVLLGEITGSDEMLYAHGPDGFHAQRPYTGGSLGITQYALNDRLGSVRMLTNGRDITSTTHYDAWGQIRTQNGTAKSALGFTGEQSFADGTVYLRARHYLPAQGRFLQRDSIDAGFAGQDTQGHGRFTYAGGRPTATTDPSGHVSLTGSGGAYVPPIPVRPPGSPRGYPKYPVAPPKPGGSTPDCLAGGFSYSGPRGTVAVSPSGRTALVKMSNGSWQVLIRGTGTGKAGNGAELRGRGFGEAGQWSGNAKYGAQEMKGGRINTPDMIWIRNQLHGRGVAGAKVVAIGHSLGAWEALALQAEGTVRGGVVSIEGPGAAMQKHLIPALKNGKVTAIWNDGDPVTGNLATGQFAGAVPGEAFAHPNFYPVINPNPGKSWPDNHNDGDAIKSRPGVAGSWGSQRGCNDYGCNLEPDPPFVPPNPRNYFPWK